MTATGWIIVWLAINVAVVVCLAWCAAPDVRDPDDHVDIDALHRDTADRYPDTMRRLAEEDDE